VRRFIAALVFFDLGANYSLSNASCGDAEKVLRTGEQSGDKSPQSKKMQNSNYNSQILKQAGGWLWRSLRRHG
jgi:hypothetical protein